MSAIFSEKTHIFRTIGPVVYVDEPHEVEAVFKNAPQTGAVIVQTSLPKDVLRELPEIHRLAKHHTLRSNFNRACQNKKLARWINDQIDELGPEYPAANLFRTQDIMTSWHVDLMSGRRRAFIQIDGVGLKFANPSSVMQLEFDSARNSRPYFPPDIDQNNYLQALDISIVKLLQGHMAVFGDYGLHASGEGEKLRAIAH